MLDIVARTQHIISIRYVINKSFNESQSEKINGSESKRYSITTCSKLFYPSPTQKELNKK